MVHGGRPSHPYHAKTRALRVCNFLENITSGEAVGVGGWRLGRGVVLGVVVTGGLRGVGGGRVLKLLIYGGGTPR